MDIVQRDVNIVLPNPIRDSFHDTANHVFKDNLSRLKYFFLVLKLNPIYVGLPSRQHNKYEGDDALQRPISNSLINLCYTVSTHAKVTLENTCSFIPKHPKVPGCYKYHILPAMDTYSEVLSPATQYCDQKRMERWKSGDGQLFFLLPQFYISPRVVNKLLTKNLLIPTNP